MKTLALFVMFFGFLGPVVNSTASASSNNKHATEFDTFTLDIASIHTSKGLYIIQYALPPQICGICRVASPILDRVGRELSDKVKIVRIGALYNNDGTYGINQTIEHEEITSFPQFDFYIDGKRTAIHGGMINYNSVANWVNENSN